MKHLPQFIEDRIARIPECGCWLWLGATSAAGYGQKRINDKTTYVHRIAWAAYHGTIPSGMFVLHRCDIPCCCNPAHLFIGDDAANHADMVAKNRHTFGERDAMAKLSTSAATAILFAGGTHQSIADHHGVSRSLVGKIKSRKKWRHL